MGLDRVLPYTFSSTPEWKAWIDVGEFGFGAVIVGESKTVKGFRMRIILPVSHQGLLRGTRPRPSLEFGAIGKGKVRQGFATERN